MSTESDEAYWARFLANKKAEQSERRRQSRTPAGIESTNRRKRNGNLSYSISADGATITVEARTNSPASSLVLHLLQAAGAKLYEDKRDKRVSAVITMAKPEAIRKVLKLVDVPEKCVRCSGHGSLGLDDKPSLYATGGGGNKLCPVCRGNGRALVEDAAVEKP